MIAYFEVFRKYFMNQEERNAVIEPPRSVSEGGIVIGSSLQFQNLRITKLRKNETINQKELEDTANDSCVHPEKNQG